MNEKSSNYHLFHLFGWRIYISKESLKPRARSSKRKSAYYRRMDQAGYECEVCGAHLTKFGHMLHTLPKGAESRNTVDELRVLCSECFNRVQREISLRCYDNTVPAYSEIVNQVLAEASLDPEKGGEK